MKSHQVKNLVKVALMLAGTALLGSAVAGTTRGAKPPAGAVVPPATAPVVVTAPATMSAPPVIVDPSTACQNNGSTTASRC